MRKIKFLLFFLFGLVLLTSCGLNHTSYPKQEVPFSGADKFVVTVKDFETKQEIAQVSKMGGYALRVTDFSYNVPEGYAPSIVDEDGMLIDVSRISGDMTVYVMLSPLSYPLAFYEHGTIVEKQYVEYGSAIELIDPKMVPSGYEFVGWYTEKDGGELFSAGEMPAHALSLYAHYEQVPYSINFVTGLAELAQYESDAMFFAGDRLGDFVPAALKQAMEALDQYSFVGWYTDAALTKPFEDVVMPSHDVTLYAKWAFEGISFNDGDVIIDVPTPNEQGYIERPADPEKQGYTFDDWYLDENFNTLAVFPIEVTGEAFKIYAKFIPNDNTAYHVEYYLRALNGSYIRQEVIEYYGTTDAQISALIKSYTGFHFDESNSLNKKDGKILADESLLLKVYYARNEYQISFLNCDFEPITYLYGQSIGAIAEPEQTGQTFIGWDIQVPATMPADDVVLTAQWSTNAYRIKFISEGVELQSSNVNYGEMPVYSGTEPTKPADTQYTYTFIGWDPEIEVVTGAATYTAVFSATVNQYEIKFVSEGVELQSGLVAYGQTPVYNGETPVKAATAQYTYTFSGWNPEIEAVSGVATYTAQFDATVNEYEIKFVSEGVELQSGLVAYGQTPVYNGTMPAKEATAQYTYVFSGWNPEIEAVSGAQTYTAQFDALTNSYLVKFISEGVVLQEGEVAFGETPVYTGATPIKEATAQYTYTFSGWEPEIEAVSGIATYTAKFSATLNKYLIKFVNGEQVLQESEVEYGQTPVYAGAEPTKEATAQYTYAFLGWNPEIEAVSGEATYTAQFSSTVNKYLIKFVNGETVLQESEVEYGQTPVYAGAEPTKVADAQYTYTFAGWDPEIASVTGAQTYTAQFSSTVNKYLIKFVDGEQTIQEEELEYGAPIIAPADPEAEGFIFLGWNPEVPETVSGAAEFVAQWQQIVYQDLAFYMNGTGTAANHVDGAGIWVWLDTASIGMTGANFAEYQTSATVEGYTVTQNFLSDLNSTYVRSYVVLNMAPNPAEVTEVVIIIKHGNDYYRGSISFKNGKVYDPNAIYMVTGLEHDSRMYLDYGDGNWDVIDLSEPVAFGTVIQVKFYANDPQTYRLYGVFINGQKITPTYENDEYYFSFTVEGNTDVNIVLISDADILPLELYLDGEGNNRNHIEGAGAWIWLDTASLNVTPQNQNSMILTVTCDALSVNEAFFSDFTADYYRLYVVTNGAPAADQVVTYTVEIFDGSKVYQTEVKFLNGELYAPAPAAKLNGVDYTSIQAAIDAASSNDTIYVYPGSWNEELTINKNITLASEANMNVAGYSDSRQAESIITGAVTITSNGVIINGLAFDEAGTIKVNASNVTLTNIKMTAEPAYVENNLNAQVFSGDDIAYLTITDSYFNTGELSGTRDCLGFGAHDVENIAIQNCHFENEVASGNFSTDEAIRIKQLGGYYNSIVNNVFNFSTGSKVIYLGEGMNNTYKISIKDNVLNGAGNSSTTVIYLGSTIKTSEITVEHNEINTTGTYTLQLSGSAQFSFYYNYFENNYRVNKGTTNSSFVYEGNCYHGGHYNNTASTPEDYQDYADYDKDAMEVAYYAWLNPSVAYDLDGGAWNGEAGLTTLTHNVEYTLPTNVVREGFAFLGWFIGEQEITTVLNKQVSVKAHWQELTPAARTKGVDYYTIQEAIDAAEETVYVYPGTWNESIVINKDITINCDNAWYPGNDPERGPEATITGLVTIASNNVTINGLQFTENATILVNGDRASILYVRMLAEPVQAGTDVYAQIRSTTAISDVSINQSYFNAGSGMRRGCIGFSGAVDAAHISDNVFVNENETPDSGEAIRIKSLVGYLDIERNTFDFATNTTLVYINESKTSGTILGNIIDNEFGGYFNGYSTILYLGTGSEDSVYTVEHNKFNSSNPTTSDFPESIILSGVGHLNVYFNYFDEKYWLEYGPADSQLTYTGNCYKGGSFGTTPDYQAYEEYDLAAMEVAYLAWKNPSVTYDLDGGSWVGQAGQTVLSHDFEYILPTNVEKEGYEFLGWFVGDEQITSVLNKQVSVKAHWASSEFAITYNLDGGQFPLADPAQLLNSVLLTDYITYKGSTGYETSLITPSVSKPTYWYYITLKESDISGIYTIVQIVNSLSGVTDTDYDLAIIWHDALQDATAKATLTSIYNNRSSYLDKVVVLKNVPAASTADAEITAEFYPASAILSIPNTFEPLVGAELIAPVKEGYNFLGWYDNAEFNGDAIESIPANTNHNVELFAKWEVAIVYSNITYDLDGGQISKGDAVSTIDINVFNQQGATANFEAYDGMELFKSGISIGSNLYWQRALLKETFIPGVYVVSKCLASGASLSGHEYDYIILAFNTPYTTTLKNNVHEGDIVTFNADLASLTAGEQSGLTVSIYDASDYVIPETQYAEGTEFILPTNVEKENYIFGGWILDSQTVNSIPADSTGDVTVKALWIGQNTILWDANGGNVSGDENGSIEYYTGDVVSLPTPEREGYIFAGWYQGDELVTTIESGDYNLVAHWNPMIAFVNGNPVGFATLADAVAAAQNGDTINLVAGTFAGANINKSLTIVGPNADINPNEGTRVSEAIINSDLTISASDIVFNGIQLTAKARFKAATSLNINNLTITNVLVRGSTVNSGGDSSNGPLYLVAGSSYTISNVSITNCRFDEYSTSGRPMIAFIDGIENLTIENNVFIARHQSYNDGIKTDSTSRPAVKGEVNISNNYFQDFGQYVIWIRTYGPGNYTFEGNSFKHVGQTAANHAAFTLIKYIGESTDNFQASVKYNEVDQGYMLLRIDNTAAHVASHTAYVQHNALHDNCAGSYYIKNSSAVTIIADDNYWGTSTPAAAKFTGVSEHTNDAVEIDPILATIDGWKHPGVSYDLDGGAWNGVAGQTELTHNVEYILPTNVQKEGSEFLGWFVGDEQIASVLNKQVSVKAHWHEIVYYNVTVAGAENTNHNLQASYQEGTQVEFTIVPTADKYEIVSVTSDEATITLNEGVYSFTISQNTTINVVVAEYAEDILNNGLIGVTGTSYANWPSLETAYATYAGYSAGGNSSIQLRSQSPSGIVITKTAGLVKKIVLVFNENTAADRVVDIYGSNTPYTGPLNLYDSSARGTKIGSVKHVEGTDKFVITVDGDYKYIGIRSNSNALYLDSFNIYYEEFNKYHIAVEENDGITSGLPVDEYEGNTVEFYAYPRNGFKIDSVTLVGDNLNEVLTPVDGNKYSFIATKNATVVVATSVQTAVTYEVTIEESNGGSVTQTTAYDLTAVEEGTTVEFAVSHQDYAKLVKVEVNGVEVEVINNQFSVEVDEDITIAAIFAPDTKTTGLTADAPLDAEDAVKVAKFAGTTATTEQYYIEGVVTGIATAYSSQYGNVSVNIGEGSNTFQLFRITVESETSIEVGDTIKVLGNIVTYVKDNKSTYETSAAPTVVSLIKAPTYNVTFVYESEQVTVNKENGDYKEGEFTFTATAKTGYEIVSVSDGTNTLEKVNGKYSIILSDDVTITITSQESQSQEPTISYQKVQASSELEDGMIIVIGNVNGGFAAGALSNTSTKYLLKVDIANENIAETDGVMLFTLEQHGEHWYIKYSNGKYLSWTSGNSANESTSGYDWDISISNGTVTITSVADSTRKLQYNAGSPRFACYTSSQQALCIYKQVITNA